MKGYNSRMKRGRGDESGVGTGTEGAVGSSASVPAENNPSTSSPSSPTAARPAPMPGIPINVSAELAAGRVKIGRSSFWNEERDALLVEAVELYGKDWSKICMHVGEGANSDRCWQRWNRYLKPDAMVCKTDPWTTEEVRIRAYTCSTQ